MIGEKERKQKEQAEKIKALRRELEEKIEEQLPAELLQDPQTRVEVQRIQDGEPLDPVQAKRVIEALLFAASKPLTPQEIRKVIKAMTPKELERMIFELRDEYVREGRSFEIVEVAGGYEIATRKEFAPWILKIELQKKAKQVTLSALETLAIMAYKQPITRAEIEELRGVDVSGVMTTLTERCLIKIVGKKEVPGRPFLYGTTEKFLEHFGLKSLEDLPPIAEIRSLVEGAVRREDLLGTTKMVEIPQEETEAASGETPAENLSAEPAADLQEPGSEIPQEAPVHAEGGGEHES